MTEHGCLGTVTLSSADVEHLMSAPTLRFTVSSVTEPGNFVIVRLGKRERPTP